MCKNSLIVFGFILCITSFLFAVDNENLRFYCFLKIDKNKLLDNNFEQQALALIEDLAIEIGSSCFAYTKRVLYLEEELRQKIILASKNEEQINYLLRYTMHLKLQAKHYVSFFDD